MCKALESRFDDNGIMIVFVGVGYNKHAFTPSRYINWGMTNLKLLCGRYGVKYEVIWRRAPILKNLAAIESWFLHLKL